MARDDVAAWATALADITATAEKVEASGKPEDVAFAAQLRERRDRLIGKVNAGTQGRTPREMQRLADAAVILAVEGHRHQEADDVSPELAALVPEGVKFPRHRSFAGKILHPIDTISDAVDEKIDGAKKTAGNVAIGIAAVAVVGGLLYAASRDR